MAREIGNTEDLERNLRELKKQGVTVKFGHRPKKVSATCLHCDRDVYHRGVCKSHHKALLDMVRRGEITDAELVAAGVIIASQNPGRTAPTLGIKSQLREKIRQWQVKEN